MEQLKDCLGLDVLEPTKLRPSILQNLGERVATKSLTVFDFFIKLLSAALILFGCSLVLATAISLFVITYRALTG